MDTASEAVNARVAQASSPASYSGLSGEGGIIWSADVCVRGDLTDGQDCPSSVFGETFKTRIVAIKEVPPRSGGPGGRLQRPCNSSSVRATMEKARPVPIMGPCVRGYGRGC